MTVATQQFSGTYQADPDHSSVAFGVRHMGVSTFRAGFSELEARLVLDDSGGGALEGAARVESLSISAPPEFREHVVNGTDFFDAPAHPTIAFRSSALDLGEDGAARLDGELTIKGVTKPITAHGRYEPPVEDPFGGVRAALELEATVDRRDWGLDWQMPLPKGGDALGYEVALTVHLELVQESQ